MLCPCTILALNYTNYILFLVCQFDTTVSPLKNSSQLFHFKAPTTLGAEEHAIGLHSNEKLEIYKVIYP
jgi:hypothetical protein